MINLDLLSENVLNDILNSYDYHEMGPEQQKGLLKMLENSSVEELFDRYLSWNGIINYTRQLIDAYEGIKNGLST